MTMPKYKVIFGSRVDNMLLRHVEFLARVSVPAAKQFRNEFKKVIREIEDNPYQFPYEVDMNLPADTYHKAIFAKRYKALFLIEDKTVYLDAVIDCRQDNS